MDISPLLNLGCVKLALIILKENESIRSSKDLLNEKNKNIVSKYTTDAISSYLIEYIARYCDLENIPWKVERIIWIGFHNNVNNKKCSIPLLPKHVVSHLLSFLRLQI